MGHFLSEMDCKTESKYYAGWPMRRKVLQAKTNGEEWISDKIRSQNFLKLTLPLTFNDPHNYVYETGNRIIRRYSYPYITYNAVDLLRISSRLHCSLALPDLFLNARPWRLKARVWFTF